MRENIKSNVENFYYENSISPKSFNCKNTSYCKSIIGNEQIACGPDAHIGTRYGESIKVLVVSLDTGGDSECIENRTNTIETLDYSTACQHTKGTKLLIDNLFKLLGINDENSFKYVSMTNAAKCSRIRNKNKLPSKIYKACAEFHAQEISYLEPDVIYTEGVDSFKFLKNIENERAENIEMYLADFVTDTQNIDKFKSLLTNRIRRMNLNGRKAIVVRCPHPSSRNGEWSKFKYNEMNCINDYIWYQLRVA